MELKKLEKASKLLERVKELDKEIIEIDRKANLILDNETKITFELRVKKKNEKPIKEDFKIKPIELRVSFFSMFSELEDLQKCKKLNEELINIEKIDDKTALAILGVMLNKKNDERNKLLKQIENIFK